MIMSEAEGESSSTSKAPPTSVTVKKKKLIPKDVPVKVANAGSDSSSSSEKSYAEKAGTKPSTANQLGKGSRPSSKQKTSSNAEDAEEDREIDDLVKRLEEMESIPRKPASEKRSQSLPRGPAGAGTGSEIPRAKTSGNVGVDPSNPLVPGEKITLPKSLEKGNAKTGTKEEEQMLDKVAEKLNSDKAANSDKKAAAKMVMKPVMVKKKASSTPQSRSVSKRRSRTSTAQGSLASVSDGKLASISESINGSKINLLDNISTESSENKAGSKTSSTDSLSQSDASNNSVARGSADALGFVEASSGDSKKSATTLSDKSNISKANFADVSDGSMTDLRSSKNFNDTIPAGITNYAPGYHHTSTFAKTSEAADGFYAMGLPSPPPASAAGQPGYEPNMTFSNSYPSPEWEESLNRRRQRSQLPADPEQAWAAMEARRRSRNPSMERMGEVGGYPAFRAPRQFYEKLRLLDGLTDDEFRTAYLRRFSRRSNSLDRSMGGGGDGGGMMMMGGGARFRGGGHRRHMSDGYGGVRYDGPYGSEVRGRTRIPEEVNESNEILQDRQGNIEGDYNRGQEVGGSSFYNRRFVKPLLNCCYFILIFIRLNGTESKNPNYHLNPASEKLTLKTPVAWVAHHYPLPTRSDAAKASIVSTTTITMCHCMVGQVEVLDMVTILTIGMTTLMNLVECGMIIVMDRRSEDLMILMDLTSGAVPTQALTDLVVRSLSPINVYFAVRYNIWLLTR
jgi:hypothetical protein